jgi:transposase InsO family protein
MQKLIAETRRRLDQEGAFCGAQAIRWELEGLGLSSPSVPTIARMLRRQQLTRRRSERYQPKGTRYPRLLADAPGAMHQTDFVGPCYLLGGIRFHSLNTVDLRTGRGATVPLEFRAGQNVIDAFWKTWNRLGFPRIQQIDNESVFYGSRAHPPGMGHLIRLCLQHGIEPLFIPPAEPWRNGVVEKFNDHWRQKFLARFHIASFEQLELESIRFDARHNHTWRYTKLNGSTPDEAFSRSATPVRFPAQLQPPLLPLAKPQTGRYHLIRLIRSDHQLDVFGERFSMPRETVHEYVRATIDVGRQVLEVRLDDRLVDSKKYKVR